MSTELERSKETMKKHNELLVEKSYLESQVTFFKSQLDENKRLHDALLMALQREIIFFFTSNIFLNLEGINSNDNENTNELVETNRYLSAAMEKIEIRCKILEEKAEKLKNFKKMVKNSSSMQCLHCSKHITNAIFLQHVDSCLTDLQNPPQNSSKPISQGKYSQSSIGSNNDLLISINQTMVKESADNKPFTEYLIQVTLNNNKWTIARKYKNFCELHQQLYASFQHIKFPESVATVMNSTTDVNNIFNSKRPTVIEERRKALQQFLRDLSKIDCVRHCKQFKNFLEIEKGDQNENFPTQENQTKSKSVIATIISLNSQREIKSVYNNYAEEKKGTNKASFSSNLMLPDEMPGKEINLKIDKKMLPPSPSSFLNSWNNDRLLISHMNPNNKENKNPRSKSVSDNKCLNLPPPELINNPAQTLVNDEENDTDRIANIDVSNISSTLQADTQSFQEISNEKSILSLLKGENQQFAMMSSKNGTNLYNAGKTKTGTHLDLYHSNQRPQSYYSKNIYAHNNNNKETNIGSQPNNSSYSSNYEKRKNEKGSSKLPAQAPEKYKNIKLDTKEY